MLVPLYEAINMKFCFTGFVVVFLFFLNTCSGNIHRAVPGAPGFVKNTKIKHSAVIEELEEEEEDGLGLLTYIYNIKTNKAWLYAVPAAILVGSTGIFPLLIFRVEPDHSLKEAISPSHLKLLLSFAVGGLLGDVFLHLLPEAYMYVPKDTHGHSLSLNIGLWVIAGFLCFLILEKVFMEEEKIKERLEEAPQKSESTDVATENMKLTNGLTNGKSLKNSHVNGLSNGHTNGHIAGYKNGEIKKRKIYTNEYNQENTSDNASNNDENSVSEDQIKVIGYLNLLANCIDNFTHGLAVAGSFLVSVPVGTCTTFAILLHEIPHEIGDFAILLKAGFKRWDAAKGQLLTASGALFGCFFGLLSDSAGDTSAWVLPFTSGGFIYIALVTVVPDLQEERSSIESVKQICALLAGVGVMCLVGMLHH